MKIGLALSGGGFRATVFHLGVLARLAEAGRLEDVTFLSTVSGGSLCVGLVVAMNGFRWPTSSEYVDQVLPRAYERITTCDLQRKVIWRALSAPWRIFKSRAATLSLLLRTEWGVAIRLSDLPEQPRWMINATCYESGKNWRFERFRMGDYLSGYTEDTHIPLSDALAASAGFPGLIGPLALDTRAYSWFDYADAGAEESALTPPEAHRRRARTPIVPAYARLHLWDGGVYDNLSLEGLHNFEEGWRKDVEFLVVSDASGRAKAEAYRWWKALMRIITGIMMDQVRSLRSRALLERLRNHKDPGAFLQIGNTCEDVFRRVGQTERISEVCPDCLSREEALRAATMETVIRRLTPEEFERLFRHGFEVADYTLYAYHPDEFPYVGYTRSGWAYAGRGSKGVVEPAAPAALG